MAGISDISSVLYNELRQLEGLHGQNLETGTNIGSNMSYLDQYTNKVFGAPYQLLDSVDKRFSNINPNLGNEYLRNFILNSPILHIKPGLPKYTGRDKGLLDSIKQVYTDSAVGGMPFTTSLLGELAKTTIFGKGSQLQKRMFGFSEQYYQYIQHVNYMCRSLASFLGLTTNTKFPNGIATASGMQEFKTMKWENYRMLTKTKYADPNEQLGRMTNATLIGAAGSSIGDTGKSLLGGIGRTASEVAASLNKMIVQGDDRWDTLSQLGLNLGDSGIKGSQDLGNKVAKNFKHALTTSVSEVTFDKVSSVQFMVEPVQFEERLSNEVKNSMIEDALDGISKSVGSEIAFITGSNVDFGLVEGMASMLGNTVQTAAGFLQGLVEPISGGFASNLFSGALRSIKGQKMIYPKIYGSSDSSMNYQFTVNLYSPYGDVYNYYINELVPLSHLICLASPRMVSANSTTSPYLVQAFIPGQCTCQLGMITDMTVVKNPSGKHVSVHGFPLDIKVTFTITELYNAMAISPANDPSSFLYNETLNDYMANLAGLMPSVDTYTQQRKATFENTETYFKKTEFFNDFSNDTLHKVEDLFNPYAGR